MTELVAREFPVHVVTLVRHPLDSWLSLNANGWVHFQPGTLDEYARRYLTFLDQTHAGRIVKYGSFVADPDALAGWVCEWLDLAFNPHWQDLIGAVRLSGASGQSGDVIMPRARAAAPEAVIQAAGVSVAYDQLCAQLGYNPDPASTPIARQG